MDNEDVIQNGRSCTLICPMQNLNTVIDFLTPDGSIAASTICNISDPDIRPNIRLSDEQHYSRK
uniref:Uncharacterized protein n=1 Tax=Romanomermis culicivorax TaxID=13658 RepID=A0A915HGL8_ROMCU